MSVDIRALLLLLLPFALGAGSTPLVLTSGQQTTALLELYTSEGCSSCPPADRWLSGQRRSAGLWTEFVPVAFHVDYWDYIGWQDRFARANFSSRQRRYQAEGAVGVVYTPGIFSGGKEWTGWRRGAAVVAPDTQPGRLTARIDQRRVELQFAPSSGSDEPLLGHVALLGMNLLTSVAAGENRGKTLRHDFVVLELEQIELTRSGSGYVASALLPASDADTDELAVAVWVTNSHSQQPLQAVGGMLTD